MFQSTQIKRTSSSNAVVDIAPLIDIVFILLIFFLVTATFVRDAGIEVQRPEATAVSSLEPTSFRVSIASSGQAYVEGEVVSMPQLRDRVKTILARERHQSVIVIPDETVTAKRLVEVMDVAKGAGAKDVAIATRQQP